MELSLAISPWQVARKLISSAPSYEQITLPRDFARARAGSGRAGCAMIARSNLPENSLANSVKRSIGHSAASPKSDPGEIARIGRSGA